MYRGKNCKIDKHDNTNDVDSNNGNGNGNGNASPVNDSDYFDARDADAAKTTATATQTQTLAATVSSPQSTQTPPPTTPMKTIATTQTHPSPPAPPPPQKQIAATILANLVHNAEAKRRLVCLARALGAWRREVGDMAAVEAVNEAREEARQEGDERGGGIAKLWQAKCEKAKCEEQRLMNAAQLQIEGLRAELAERSEERNREAKLASEEARLASSVNENLRNLVLKFEVSNKVMCAECVVVRFDPLRSPIYYTTAQVESKSNSVERRKLEDRITQSEKLKAEGEEKRLELAITNAKESERVKSLSADNSRLQSGFAQLELSKAQTIKICGEELKAVSERCSRKIAQLKAAFEESAKRAGSDRAKGEKALSAGKKVSEPQPK